MHAFDQIKHQRDDLESNNGVSWKRIETPKLKNASIWARIGENLIIESTTPPMLELPRWIVQFSVRPLSTMDKAFSPPVGDSSEWSKINLSVGHVWSTVICYFFSATNIDARFWSNSLF